ncbi:hypothetical protein AMTR_s00017p00206360 [Amborella trichopoda]|uniref:Uncharacterized protein n=1 Tax=Amborella trichopoda TaxID=13333 RepID=W1PF98_AMBTC|nr:hypothetical protein AMTR_s00017p00206360 [Amborella trichopoda]
MDHDRVSVITFIIFGVSSAFPDRLSPFATMEQSPSPENRDYLAASLWTVWKERNYRTSVLKGFSEFIKKILLADMQPERQLLEDFSVNMMIFVYSDLAMTNIVNKAEMWAPCKVR